MGVGWTCELFSLFIWEAPRLVSSEIPQNLLGRGISLMSHTQNQVIDWGVEYFDDSTESGTFPHNL